MMRFAPWKGHHVCSVGGGWRGREAGGGERVRSAAVQAGSVEIANSLKARVLPVSSLQQRPGKARCGHC